MKEQAGWSTSPTGASILGLAARREGAGANYARPYQQAWARSWEWLAGAPATGLGPLGCHFRHISVPDGAGSTAPADARSCAISIRPQVPGLGDVPAGDRRADDGDIIDSSWPASA